jgi:hypothetical protein
VVITSENNGTMVPSFSVSCVSFMAMSTATMLCNLSTCFVIR